MVRVNCGAIPEGLIDSELFGHERGAFTGAVSLQRGRFERAHGGTLFLDEVGELPLAMQRTFLRVLQERRFRPLGGKGEEESDFRLLAATNRDLDTLVAEGRFRSDLLFRLRSFTIELPPLRERRGDLEELVLAFVKEFCERAGAGAKSISPDVFDALGRYDWPGNVRELRNALEKACATAADEAILFQKHLPTYLRVRIAQANIGGEEGAPAPAASRQLPFREYRDAILAQLERAYLVDLMSEAAGDIQKAREVSGLSRTRLYALLKKHDLSRFGR
jgi:two-component system NtrC family response regulator